MRAAWLIALGLAGCTAAPGAAELQASADASCQGFLNQNLHAMPDLLLLKTYCALAAPPYGSPTAGGVCGQARDAYAGELGRRGKLEASVACWP
jgi:hypothetical protein